MTIDMNSPFKAGPRISKQKFVGVLQSVGSFDVDALWAPTPKADRPAEAGRIYDLIVSVGHDPAVWLAIPGKEHTWGTNQKSVLWRNNTRSWTNARSVRHPEVRKRSEIITDSQRRSQYVRYQSVYDSVLDGLYRVDEPGFAYRQANAISIYEHIAVWAPKKDGNDPEGYSRTMATWINEWAAADSGELPKPEEPMTAQIPGFTWEPANTSHYERGRVARIRGGAQHYTAGTDSLPWLTKTSRPPVSANFLIKHNPTLQDRGWQLVRIEDTAWTTAFANPYTVSIEYEHTGSGTIPDVAYEVIAQTWIDIAAYVKRHNLGEIPLDRTGIRGHREWVNNPALICPDGIELDRIVAEIKRLQGESVDPDALYIAGNPFGEVPVVLGFRQLFLDMGAARFPDDPIAGGLSLFGYPIGPEYPTLTGSAQEFERAVFKYEAGKPRPWDVVVALRSEGLPERRGA